MTNRNRRENVGEELARADSFRDAANVLYEHGFLNDAVSRLYYYLLCHIRALLMTKGLEPRSPEGAMRLFSLHFVKNGSFPAESSHVFSKLMKLREEADYNPSYSFTAEEFLIFRKEAEELGGKIRAYIQDGS